MSSGMFFQQSRPATIACRVSAVLLASCSVHVAALAQSPPASSAPIVQPKGIAEPNAQRSSKNGLSAQAAQRPGGTWQSIAKLPQLTSSWGVDDSTLAVTIVLDNVEFPPLKPEYMAKSKAFLEAIKAGKKDQPSVDCRPPGFPWMIWYAYGMSMYMFPGGVLQMFNGDHVRTIDTTGQPHPAALSDPDALENQPSPGGHSIGHWEGTTLVVDSIGYGPENQVAHDVPNGGNMRITERYRLRNADLLEAVVTVDAPKVLERPWTFTRLFHRQGMSVVNQGYGCKTANVMEAIDAEGNLTLDLRPPSERAEK